MNAVLRSVVAASVSTLIIAATETIAAYAHPSEASKGFFQGAVFLYLPVAIVAAWVVSLVSPDRGLDFWFPFLTGALRLAGPLAAQIREGHWIPLLLTIGAVASLLLLRTYLEKPEAKPPFLFGLTVGMVLPILLGRLAVSQAQHLGGTNRALWLGVVCGMLVFVLLRSFVTRWPRVMPIFLLGPVISLGLWSLGGVRREALPTPLPGTATQSPDIVLIVLDTVRAQALSSYGNLHDTMPSLERFARGSTRFERAWSNGSWTLPAHASLFSGLRLTRHRYDSGFAQGERLDPDRFLAERLRLSGYATAAVAANFGVFSRKDPLLRGFESVDVEPLRPFVFRPWFFDLIYWWPNAPWVRSQTSKFPGPTMRAPWVVDRALAFWRHEERRPRFLVVNFMEAHLPWIPEPDDLGLFGPRGLEHEKEQLDVLGRYLHQGRPTPSEVVTLRARYEEALRSLDRSLSRLLAGVASPKPGREVVVVVTSDHGESLGEHDRFGHRNSLDEEATRIPMIIRGQGFGAGTLKAPVELSDIYLYLARRAGLPPEPDLDARPFGERRYVLLEHRPGPQGALPSSYPRGDLTALVDWPYKYIEGPGIEAALFNLEQDPAEQSTLVRSDPLRAEGMRLVLRELSRGASSPTVFPDRDAEERLRALGYVR